MNSPLGIYDNIHNAIQYYVVYQLNSRQEANNNLTAKLSKGGGTQWSEIGIL